MWYFNNGNISQGLQKNNISTKMYNTTPYGYQNTTLMSDIYV